MIAQISGNEPALLSECTVRQPLKPPATWVLILAPGSVQRPKA
jgi:hypothetical protein